MKTKEAPHKRKKERINPLKVVLFILAIAFGVACSLIANQASAQTTPGGPQLIRNPYFEEYDTCVATLTQWRARYPAKHWIQYNTPDFLVDSCGGQEMPWPVHPNNNQFGWAPGKSFAGMLTRDQYGWSGEKISQAFPHPRPSGWWEIGISVHKAQWGAGAAPSTSMAIILDDSANGGCDTIITRIFDKEQWIRWDTVLYIQAPESIRIMAGGNYIQNGYFLGFGYNYLDSITMEPSQPLEVISPTPMVPGRDTVLGQIGKQWDLLGRWIGGE